MPFDYQKAKKDGFSDEEIAQHLSQRSGFKYDQAVEDGFSPKQVIDKLSTLNTSFDKPYRNSPKMEEMGMMGDLTAGSSQPTLADPTADVRFGEENPERRMFPPGFEKLPAYAGAAAMVAAAPPVGIPAAAGLAALGGAGAEGLRQLAVRAAPGEPDATDNLPATSSEAAAGLLKTGAEQAALETGGRLAIKAIGKIMAPFAGKVETVGKAVNEKLKEFGSSLMPSQMTDSRTLDLVENMARGSFFGSGTMIAKETEQNTALKKMGENVGKKFAQEVTGKLSDRDAGELFADTVLEGRSAFKSAAEKLYRNVDDLVDETVTKGGQLKSSETGMFKKAIVETTALKNRANELAAEFSRIGDIGKSDAGGKLIDNIRALDDTIGFGDAQMLRSNLLSVSRDLKTFGGDSKAHAIASEMATLANGAMEEAGKKLPKNAFEAWQQANKFYKFGTKHFDNEFIANLALSGKVPWERVGEKVFASGNVEQVLKTRRALRVAEFMQKSEGASSQVRYQGDLTNLSAAKRAEVVKMAGQAGDVSTNYNFKDAWRAMQSGFYENQILAPSIKDGVVDGASFSKRIQNPKLARTMKAAFTEEQLGAVKDFANTAKLVQKRPEGGAGMVMQLAQGGAILNLVATPFALLSGAELGPTVAGALGGSGGAVFLAPRVMAELLTNPKAAKWLTEGIRLPAGSEAGTVLGARILSAASDISSAKKRENFEQRRKAKGLPIVAKR